VVKGLGIGLGVTVTVMVGKAWWATAGLCHAFLVAYLFTPILLLILSFENRPAPFPGRRS